MYDSLKWAMMPRFRRKRMESFVRIMRPSPRARILDVGGLPHLRGLPGFWENSVTEFNVTLLNLPGAYAGFSKAELAPFNLIEADACSCSWLPRGYDIIFSNSVIEHVGSRQRQQAFANFVRSSGTNYWIQTPSPCFPIEAHCNVPFWWLIPSKSRIKKIRDWRKTNHIFLAQQMATTRAVSLDLLRSLFPDCAILNERFFGMSKSLIAYRKIRFDGTRT